MATKKITDLDAITVPVAADLFEIVDDVAGTATSKKITWANLFATALPLTSGQITFPATAVPSADANTLDDYEQGSWTPAVTFGGAAVSVTYHAGNNGKYTIVGDRVFYTGILWLTNKGTSNGAAIITGLPVAVGSDDYSSAPAAMITSDLAFVTVPAGLAKNGATTISLMELVSTAVGTTITDGDFENATFIRVSGSYNI